VKSWYSVVYALEMRACLKLKAKVLRGTGFAVRLNFVDGRLTVKGNDHCELNMYRTLYQCD